MQIFGTVPRYACSAFITVESPYDYTPPLGVGTNCDLKEMMAEVIYAYVWNITTIWVFVIYYGFAIDYLY